MMKQYIKFNDPAHGWLRVTRLELYRLGILDKVSSYSYERNGWVYLEEDGDLNTFIRRMIQIYPHIEHWSDIPILNKHCNGDSAIRSYEPFKSIEISLLVYVIRHECKAYWLSKMYSLTRVFHNDDLDCYFVEFVYEGKLHQKRLSIDNIHQFYYQRIGNSLVQNAGAK